MLEPDQGPEPEQAPPRGRRQVTIDHGPWVKNCEQDRVNGDLPCTVVYLRQDPGTRVRFLQEHPLGFQCLWLIMLIMVDYLMFLPTSMYL